MGAGKAFVEDALQAGVVLLDGDESVIDPFADVGLLGLVADVLPACRFRHPEDIRHRVEIAVFQQMFELAGFADEKLTVRVGEFPLQLVEAFIEGVGDVLEEDEAEDDMLVFSGIHVRPQLVGSRPECFVQVLVHALCLNPCLPLTRREERGGVPGSGWILLADPVPQPRSSFLIA